MFIFALLLDFIFRFVISLLVAWVLILNVPAIVNNPTNFWAWVWVLMATSFLVTYAAAKRE